MSAWAQIWGDEVAATFTPGTTDFEIFPGSTLWSNECGGGNFIQPHTTGASGLRFVVGNQGAGIWEINWGVSFTGSVGNRNYHMGFFKNGTKLGKGSIERKVGTAGDVGGIAAPLFVLMKDSTDIVDFRVESTAVATITINHLTITAHRITTSTAVSV